MPTVLNMTWSDRVTLEWIHEDINCSSLKAMTIMSSEQLGFFRQRYRPRSSHALFTVQNEETGTICLLMTLPPTLYILSMKIAFDLSNTAHDKKERFFRISHYIGAVL